MSYMTGRLPLTAAGTAHHPERRRPVPARVGGDLRHLDSEEPGAGTPRATTRSRLRSLPASAWTTPSSCPPRIKEIRVGKGDSDGGAIDPLQSPLQFLKGVGPRRAADLERVGLHTVEDLLYRFPDPLRGSRHASRPSRRCGPASPPRSSAKSWAAAFARRAGRASRSSSWSCAIAPGRCARSGSTSRSSTTSSAPISASSSSASSS